MHNGLSKDAISALVNCSCKEMSKKLASKISFIFEIFSQFNSISENEKAHCFCFTIA